MDRCYKAKWCLAQWRREEGYAPTKDATDGCLTALSKSLHEKTAEYQWPDCMGSTSGNHHSQDAHYTRMGQLITDNRTLIIAPRDVTMNHTCDGVSWCQCRSKDDRTCSESGLHCQKSLDHLDRSSWDFSHQGIDFKKWDLTLTCKNLVLPRSTTLALRSLGQKKMRCGTELQSENYMPFYG